jgi:hypothetical protein
MNKIQLEAALQLAQMDFDANPNQLNEQKLKQAKQTWDQFIAPEAEEKQPEAPKKAAAKAEPKQPKAAKKVEAEKPGTIGETADSSDRDASADDNQATAESIDAVEVAKPVDEELEKKTE